MLCQSFAAMNDRLRKCQKKRGENDTGISQNAQNKWKRQQDSLSERLLKERR